MSIRMRLAVCLAGLTLYTGIPAIAQEAHYELVNLGTLRGGTTSNGHALNNLGQVTGRSTTEQWYYRAFLWSESTGMIDLGSLGQESEGWGINDHGQVVGETRDELGHWHAFLRNPGAGMASVHADGFGSGAWTINNDGLIVGWNDSIFGTSGFVLHPDGTVYLGQPGSEFYDINDPAEGESARAGGYWHNAAIANRSPVAYDTGLNTPSISPNEGIARGINRDGTLVGYDGNHPFFAKASNGYATQIAPVVAGYDSGRFFKINDAGLMVGQNRDATLPGIGVLYVEGGEITDINTLLDGATRAAWQVDTLRDANDHGYLTGTGTFGGASLAILLRPVDADGDGLNYYQETYLHGTDPALADMDNDGLNDGAEISAGTDPDAADTDTDGVPDGTEAAAGTDPLDAASVPSDVYVDGASGSDDTGLGTQAAPWATVAHAVATVSGTAQNTLSIHIAKGVYTHLNGAGGALALDSHEHLLGGYNATGWTRDPVANETVLDASVAAQGSPALNVIILDSTIDVRLDGLVIRGALSEEYIGQDAAGVLGINLDASTMITGCRIQGNYTGYYGSGGIRLIDSSPVIRDTSIVENVTQGKGGGLYAGGESAPLIERCLIGGNYASWGGGGIALEQGAIATILNCVVSGNDGRTWLGGAMYIDGGSGTLVANTTIAYNDGEQYSGGGVYASDVTATFTNVAFVGNRYYALFSATHSNQLIIRNCLFHANQQGDHVGPGGILFGAQAINANVPGASDNVDGDPLFPFQQGAWTANPTYDPVTGRTTLTDGAASFVPGALRGRMVALSARGTYQFMILDNSANTIQIDLDHSDYLDAGDVYSVMNYHLQPGSSAIDMGADTSAPEDGGVTTDFAGIARGFDGDGLGTATADGSDYDIGAFESDTPLDAIRVLAPNGGEALTRGTTAEIRWTSTGNVGASVRILIRRGAYTGTLFGSTPNDGTHSWNIPATYPIASGYTIEVVSLANPAIGDVSDASFSIAGATAPVGALTVITPNGGQTYAQGATVPITWSSSGNPGANVEILARRGGTPYSVAASTPNDGAFDWVVPADQTPGADYVIEIRSTTAATITDASDAPFTIEAAAPPADSITVLSPNGGETLVRGAASQIRWSATGNVGSTVKIVIRRGTYTGTLFGSTPNDGVQTWNIPATYPIASGYSIEITSVANPAIGDASNGTFAVDATAPAAGITVTAPNGGEVYNQGGVLPVRWTSTGDTGAQVEVLAHGAGQTISLASGTENDGAFDWTIPEGQLVGTDYTIQVRALADPALSDVSDGVFTIQSGTPPSDRITVVSPNGGETLTRGTSVELRWDSAGNVGSTVKIVIRRGAYTGTLFGATPNDGVHNWNIPATYPVASGYVIEVVSTSNPAIGDTSDAGFSITAP